jgi:hypothetical protein
MSCDQSVDTGRLDACQKLMQLLFRLGSGAQTEHALLAVLLSGGDSSQAISAIESLGDDAAFHLAMAALRDPTSPTSAPLLSWSCGLIAHRAETEAADLGGRGLCELMVALPEALPNDVAVREGAVKALRALAGDDGNLRRMLNICPRDLLAATLEPATLLACRAVQGLQASSEDKAALAEGWRAVAGLASEGESRRALARVMGVEALGEAMVRSPEDREVQLSAVTAIANLALDIESRRALGRQGACEVVAQAMQRFPERDVQVEGCRAVVNLALDDTDNLAALAKAGAARMVVQAMRRGAQDQFGAFAAVEALAGHGEMSRALGEAGACQLILQALRARDDNRDVVVKGCGALAALAAEAANRKAISKAGGWEVVVHALDRFQEKEVKAACRLALDAMSVGEPQVPIQNGGRRRSSGSIAAAF